MRELRRILCVEDDPDIRRLIEIALRNVAGFQVIVASSANEALNTIADFNPQLLVLDIMMPGADGPETLRLIRNLPDHAHTPAVFMTAKVQAHEVQDYIRLGAEDVIPKPFNPLTLGVQLRAVWDRIQKCSQKD